MIRSLLFTCLVSLLPGLASATTMVAPTDDEIVQKSEVIGMAVVRRLEVVVSPSGQIVTHAELQVERGVRGADDGAFVSMSYPGGQLPNGLKSSVAGAPVLAVGDRVFVYLHANKAGSMLPVGLRFGVLDVHRGKDGRFRASRRLEGLSFLDKSGEAIAPERFHLHDVLVDKLAEDTQARMRRLKIDAGAAGRNTSRGLSIPVVRP